MKNKGFTMIELLGMITILGIILVVAVPAVYKYATKARNQSMDSMSKSLYEAAANKFMDDGVIMKGCCINTDGDNSLDKQIDKFLGSVQENHGGGTEGADCKVQHYDGVADLADRGYVEPLSSPYRDGTMCKASIDIVKVISGRECVESKEDADNYFYRVYLNCSNHKRVTLYTTTDGEGKTIKDE